MIELFEIEVCAGDFRIGDVSLRVESGSYGVLMGRTGSGKSTVLEAVAGLRHVSSGTVRLCGTDVTAMRPALRGVGFVPQDGALFQTLSARDHLAFALEIRKAHRDFVDARVSELAALLGVEHLLDRKPATFSGGERQRVALGRALAFAPRVLLLDEPLSAVDEETREDLCDLLKLVQRETRATILHVTHHRDEAARLADVLFRIENGAVVQVATETGP